MPPGNPVWSPRAEVLLLRHAATSWNEQRRRVGWIDQALTVAGRAAAHQWAAQERLRLHAVCSSDLRRARETAEIIAGALAVDDIGAFRGLREQDQGAWTGLTKEQIKLRWPERARERPRRPVGGEPAEAVLRRALPALWLIASAHPGRRVLAVTHSNLIRILERAMALSAPAAPHLQGRWLSVPTDGPVLVTRLSAGDLTAGRVSAAAMVTADTAGATGR